jgi:hypothetical protein
MAAGAILTWGINSSSSSFNVDVIGVILMVVGFILFLISLVLWNSWWGAGFWEGWYGEGAPVARRRVYRPYARRRTTTYVEDDEPPPPAP